MCKKTVYFMYANKISFVRKKSILSSRKKNILIARQKRAEAQKKIHDTLSGMGDNSAFDTFARMEEKVDRNEAEAQAALEIAGGMGDDLDREFAALENSGGDSPSLRRRSCAAQASSRNRTGCGWVRSSSSH